MSNFRTLDRQAWERKELHLVAIVTATRMQTRHSSRGGEAISRERDVDAIGSDFHAAKQCHEHRFDFVRCRRLRVPPRSDG
jgi:hypothetical protein